MNVSTEVGSLLLQINKNRRQSKGKFDLANYLGTTHKIYNVSVPKLRWIALSWAKENQAVKISELTKLVDCLFCGQSREEKVIASMILGRFPEILVSSNAEDIDRWLGQLTGWEEVDSFCDEIDIWLRADFQKRYHVLKQWNKDKQIEKRRASLVVLCSSVRSSDDETLAQLSFQFIDKLKGEKHVIITKAISWLLRSLIKYHNSDVKRYLKYNSSNIPKIAFREVLRKLKIGRKQ